MLGNLGAYVVAAASPRKPIRRTRRIFPSISSDVGIHAPPVKNRRTGPWSWRPGPTPAARVLASSIMFFGLRSQALDPQGFPCSGHVRPKLAQPFSGNHPEAADHCRPELDPRKAVAIPTHDRIVGDAPRRIRDGECQNSSTPSMSAGLGSMDCSLRMVGVFCESHT